MGFFLLFLFLIVNKIYSLSSTINDRFVATPLPWQPPKGWNKEGLCTEECVIEEDDEQFSQILDQVYAETLVLPNTSEKNEDTVYLPRPADEIAMWDQLEKIGQVASHELVEMNKKTGLPEQKESFVIVDENACHGCSQCTSIAAMTFGTESHFGKARVHLQGGDNFAVIKEAIHACPRDAIKLVDFDELVRYERHRDGTSTTTTTGIINNSFEKDLFRKRIIGQPFADL
mmetsp:Transcript_3159/g.4391  ORF Transcript_3159/g.4391 Transcript_3159/m.4391 type:complete len:230 (-) Transcript_3159:167-856(-)|eukprot:CAMPEP_0197289124 /NCGR_PEP_ID=MMETSP0890-20130614/6330_1 /TAXON_ID=44058 ORGANISM="Aureoumbra lagunensis, Strain CCMP1510" /NCGR_SAMPLE_ID=MMETSP0890 /ASSEMBLY_ACC=CAM_ASM_000533 /LENGTH=229 /DNA_ID=CAMNT_0042760303 /DNA_START=18 /DNA_END=707 /DNA_ORIENTATION=-